MEIDPKTVALLIKLAKKNGLKSLKADGIEFAFNDEPIKHSKPKLVPDVTLQSLTELQGEGDATRR
jgi:hypothetical protein